MNDPDIAIPPPRWYQSASNDLSRRNKANESSTRAAKAHAAHGPSPEHIGVEHSELHVYDAIGPDMVDGPGAAAVPPAGAGLVGGSVETLDARIAAAAREVYLDPAMVRPGIGMPWGAAAKLRRQTKRDINAESARRRQELRSLLVARRQITARRPAGAARSTSIKRYLTALYLIGTVASVLIVGRLSVTSAENPSVAASVSAPASDPRQVNVPQFTPTEQIAVPATSQDLAAPDLSSPTAAAGSWLQRWCPYDYRTPSTTSADAAKNTMTNRGWAVFAAEQAQLNSTAWPIIVANQQTAHCTTTEAAVSIQTPRSASTAVVVVAAVRTVTGVSGSFDEPVTRQQLVIRGDDEQWRVDVPQGGA